MNIFLLGLPLAAERFVKALAYAPEVTSRLQLRFIDEDALTAVNVSDVVILPPESPFLHYLRECQATGARFELLFFSDDSQLAPHFGKRTSREQFARLLLTLQAARPRSHAAGGALFERLWQLRRSTVPQCHVVKGDGFELYIDLQHNAYLLLGRVQTGPSDRREWLLDTLMRAGEPLPVDTPPAGNWRLLAPLCWVLGERYRGRLLPGLDPQAGYRLRGWPAQPPRGNALRIVALLVRRSMRIEQMCRALGASAEEIWAVLNACAFMGYLHCEPAGLARGRDVAALPTRQGWLARLRSTLGLGVGS